MTVPELHYLVLSDIHLGHATNKADDIIDHLLKFFIKYNKYIKKVKYIFLAGDIFDRLLVNGGHNHLAVTRWLTMLAMYCKKYNIKLRILEGTPSHDWRQASVVSTVFKESKLDIDFKYIDTLHIEQDNEYGLSILYVPDEYKHTGAETLVDVKALLKTNNLTQVDIAIMHGQFHHQIPMVTLESSHDEEEYLKLVKHYINIGHIHTSSVYGRILAQGSTDRLAHNEEEAKGGMLMSIRAHGEDSYLFLENDEATIYKTVRYKDYGIIKVTEHLSKDISKLKDGSHVRIIVDKNSNLIKHKKEIASLYPNFHIKIEKESEKKLVNIEDEISSKDTITSFKITPDNIKELLTTELDKYNFHTKNINMAMEELEACI